LPVPTMSRDVKALPAIVKLSMALPAPDEIHDFNLVAFAHDGVGECRAFEDDQVVFDRDAACID